MSHLFIVTRRGATEWIKNDMSEAVTATGPGAAWGARHVRGKSFFVAKWRHGALKHQRNSIRPWIKIAQGRKTKGGPTQSNGFNGEEHCITIDRGKIK